MYLLSICSAAHKDTQILIIINAHLLLLQIHAIDDTADIGDGFQPESELDCGQGS
jgi:hypothetical protein